MSIQAAINQMLGSAGGALYQVTAPQRFATAQKQAAEEAKAKELEEQERKLKSLEIETEDLAGSASERDKATVIEDIQLARDIMKRRFEADPSAETYREYKKYRTHAKMAEKLLRPTSMSRAEESLRTAEDNAFNRIATKTETAVNQKTAMEQRLDALKLKEAAKQMRQEGAIKSNKQLKSILYKLDGKEEA